MNKCLIIFTRKYPYSYGEPFLESEIKKHIPFYNKIIVLSQDVDINDLPTREVPEEISYHNTARNNLKMSRVIDKIKCIRSGLKPNEAIIGDYSYMRKSLINKLFLWSFEERCQRLIAEAVCILEKYDLASYDEIILYSYWFFANARSAIGVKEYLESKYNTCIKIVSRAHRYDVYEDANKVNYLPMRKFLFSKIDKLFVCSENGREYLRRKYPQFSDKVELAYLGTSDFGVCQKPKEEVFHIVTCSRVMPVKRLEKLIDCLSLLEDTKYSILWTHIGGGIDGDAYFNKIKKKAEITLKEIKFEFLGAMLNKDVYHYYINKRVDVFINVSSSEGLPVSIMEAISFGIPVIATDVGGAGEIIVNGKNGYLLPKDFSNEKLKLRIEELISMKPCEIDFIRQNSRDIWKKKFDAELNYNEFVNRIYSMTV